MKTKKMMVFVIGLVMSLVSVSVAQSTDQGRLLNLSVRSPTGGGADTLIIGVTVRDGNSSLLIRAAGPTLALLNVVNPLADPLLRLYDPAQKLLDTNDDWEKKAGELGAGQRIIIDSISRGVGAFPFAEGSRDSALYVTLINGNYTLHISSADQNKPAQGIAVGEVYLVTDSVNLRNGRLTNMSARSKTGTGQNQLILGFVTAGTRPTRLLIRGIGPSLAAFGVEGLLADPVLIVRNNKGEILNPAGAFVANDATTSTNNDWSDARTVIDEGYKVGAFPLISDSKDAAVVVTVPPGSYTATVAGVGGTTGVALAEVYILP